MFFKKLTRHLPIFDNKKTIRTLKKQSQFKAGSSKIESERIILDETKKLIQQDRHKKALNNVNAAINSGLQTNQILFEKASLLAHFNMLHFKLLMYHAETNSGCPRPQKTV